jgi:tetratricopeptide (TPR) repeat protein
MNKIEIVKIPSFLIIFCFFTLSIHAQNSISISSKSEEKFNRATEFLFLEKYALAQNLFQELIKEYPNEHKSIDAQYYVALCDMYLDKNNAENLIKNFVTQYPSHPKTVFANYDLGTYYFKNKRYDDCIKYLSIIDLTVLNENNKNEANFKLAYSYMTTKNFEKAGTVFSRLKNTKNKYTFAANYYLGFINYKKELYDAALIHLKKASENASYKALTPVLIAGVYNKQKKYDTLISYSERIISQVENIKNIEEIYLLIAEASYQKSLWKKAIENFEQYGKLTKNGLIDAVSFKYGVAFYKDNQFEKSINVHKKNAEKNDTIGQYAAFYLGLGWLKLNNKPFAYNAFGQAFKMTFSPSISEQSALEYAKLGLELQKYDEIITVCKDFIYKYPKSELLPEINRILSEAYLHTNDYLTAIKHIETIKNKPNNILKTYQQVCYYHALGLLSESNYSESLEYFDKAIQNDFDKETTYMSYFFLAELFEEEKEYEKAIENYQKVIKHSIRVNYEIVAKSYYGLAYAYFNLQNYQNALINFKDFLDETKHITNKDLVCDGYSRLADCYQAVKKLKDADVYYSKAIENKCSASDYALFQKGIVLSGLNKEEEAKKALKTIPANFPNSPYLYDALYYFGLIDFENTKYSASIPAFDEIISANKSPNFVPLALQKRAIAYNNLKEYEKTVADYKQILAQYPTHRIASSAVLGLQEALSHLGKTTEMDTVINAYKSLNPQDANLIKLQFENAKNLYFSQKYTEAVSKLEIFKTDYPQSNFTPDATYFLADSYFKLNDKENAKKNFISVIEESKSSFVNKSTQKVAEIEMDFKNFTSAIQFYKKLIETAANQKEIANAWNGLMLAYYEQKDFDSSSYYANFIIKNGGTSVTFINRALLYLAKNSFAEDDDKTIDYLISCANYATDQYGAEAQYLLAQIFFEDKKYAQSIDFLFELNKKYSSYSKWIDKSFVLIADNYLMQGEKYQAKATLLSIIEKAKDSEIVAIAKEKLQKIDEQ